MAQAAENTAGFIEHTIHEFLSSSANTLAGEPEERAWGGALVGYARGDDPLFAEFKQVVGPEHWTPAEAYAEAFAWEPLRPGELTVIAWVLPQTELTKAQNRAQTEWPGERWARARIFGEEANEALRRQLVQALRERGIEAVAPVLSPGWRTHQSGPFVYWSNWSERHVAYAAGLGTFGLCDGLITPLGKAMRLGSVVARVRIPPTPRPYPDAHAYCLWFTEGICGECIQRCPVGAISTTGHDKIKCQQHLKRTSEYVQVHYGFNGYGCGLCQTNVPCESRVPAQTSKQGE